MGKPLLEVLREVALDPVEQAAFSSDPSAYLAQYGYEDVPADDLSEAFGLVADTLPPDAAQAVAATAPAATTDDLPVDDLGPGELDDPAEAGAGGFGEVTNDFDAFATGDDAEGPDLDDDLDGDFGTGEVAALGDVGRVGDGFAVGDGYDDGAFGEGSESVDLPGGYDDAPVDADDVGLDDVGLPGGFGEGPVDADDLGGADHLGGGDDVGGVLGGDHPGGYDGPPGDDAIPDDPGDFLDDIGSF